MQYKVTRIKEPPADNPDWNKRPWKEIKPLKLENTLGPAPVHFPETEAKIAHDNNSLHIIFRVKDRYVMATQTTDQHAVCQDSCVELFLTPGSNPSEGYFNIEANCSGTRLVRFQSAPGKDKILLAPEHLKLIKTSTSITGPVKEEIPDAVTWTLQHQISCSALAPYFKVSKPLAGQIWRANLYKCADKSSHPHWLCWSPITTEGFTYHVPRCFGTLVME